MLEERLVVAVRIMTTREWQSQAFLSPCGT